MNDELPLAPPDSIFALLARYKACTAKDKVNLTVGAYRDDNGKPKVLDCVRAVSESSVSKSIVIRQSNKSVC